MPFKLSSQAEADLINIYLEGVVEWGFEQAEKYQDDLDKTINMIGENPRIIRERKELNPPVHIYPVGVHVIVYRIMEDHIAHILRVRSGRENWTDDPIG